MDKLKKWFNPAKKLGDSSDSLDKKPTDTALLSQKTEYEITSMKIKQLLEKQNYSKVVEILREQPHSYVQKCLESFPFKALNRAIPNSFLVWETLLTKLHNSEEGYIPQFPYTACDELVIQIAWLLETVTESQQETSDLIQSCRRVLKCVYMQYNEVLEHLYKEHEKVGHALYTLGLHLPLGSDFLTALTVQQAIKEEVEASMADYQDAGERLEELTENEVLTLSQALGENQKPLESSDEDTEENGGLVMHPPSFPQAPNLNQVQLQERLYHNQCVITALQPSRRKDNLPELLEILKERIRGDKEVLAIFGSIRQRNDAILPSEAVEPWLKRHLHAIDNAIAMLQKIEKELEITFPKAESPVPMVVLRRDSQTQVQPVDENEQLEPIDRPRSISLESGDPSPPSTFRRHSASMYDTYKVMLEEDAESTYGMDAKERNNPNRLSAHYCHHRPRSASPHKILRVNGGPPLRSGSSKSINSSNGSTTNLVNGTSSSVHDLHSTRESQPLPAFTRVQSLKTNYSVQVVAGKRKKSSGGIFSSISANNVNSKKKPKLKKHFWSGSGSLDSGRKVSIPEIECGNKRRGNGGGWVASSLSYSVFSTTLDGGSERDIGRLGNQESKSQYLMFGQLSLGCHALLIGSIRTVNVIKFPLRFTVGLMGCPSRPNGHRPPEM